MASSVKNYNAGFLKSRPKKEEETMVDIKEEELLEAVDQEEEEDFDEFDFVDAYSDDTEESDEELLPENTAQSAINCAFLGIGGGGGKLAKAFLDSGFNRTLLVNTTIKDQPDGIDDANFLLIPGADGVGKDVELGKQVLKDNGAFVEDRLRTRFGQVDWLFVLAGGGGGTGLFGQGTNGAGGTGQAQNGNEGGGGGAEEAELDCDSPPTEIVSHLVGDTSPLQDKNPYETGEAAVNEGGGKGFTQLTGTDSTATTGKIKIVTQYDENATTDILENEIEVE